jgi:hypothetical protein
MMADNDNDIDNEVHEKHINNDVRKIFKSVGHVCGLLSGIVVHDDEIGMKKNG